MTKVSGKKSDKKFELEDFMRNLPEHVDALEVCCKAENVDQIFLIIGTLFDEARQVGFELTEGALLLIKQQNKGKSKLIEKLKKLPELMTKAYELCTKGFEDVQLHEDDSSWAGMLEKQRLDSFMSYVALYQITGYAPHGTIIKPIREFFFAKYGSMASENLSHESQKVIETMVELSLRAYDNLSFFMEILRTRREFVTVAKMVRARSIAQKLNISQDERDKLVYEIGAAMRSVPPEFKK